MSSYAIANRGESDEEFARRLYSQELGLNNEPVTVANIPPVLNRTNINNTQNPTVINARYNEVSNSRGNMIAVLIINVPQILAATIILGIHWMDNMPCDDAHQSKWKIWASISAIRMALYCALVVIMFRYKNYFELNPEKFVQIAGFRNIVDAMGLVWFIIGNLWLFGDDNSTGSACDDPGKSAIYNVCFSMIVISYIQICLPCILAALLLPLFCFCMPCLIRVIARLNNRANPGATPAAISTLPVVSIDQQHLAVLGDNRTCPICLDEIELGCDARIFRCKHVFHRNCVDEWLSVNASCPTCRMTVFGTDTTTTVAPAVPTAESSSLSEAQDSGSSSSQVFNPLLGTNTNQRDNNNSFSSDHHHASSMTQMQINLSNRPAAADNDNSSNNQRNLFSTSPIEYTSIQR